jgi:hypothetical protein
MLYALRYQKTQTPNIASLINLLLANGVPREDAKVHAIPGVLLFFMLMFALVGICFVKCRWCRSTARRPFFNRILVG